MTRDEARRIGSIVAQADGGCAYCVEHLVDALNREFPEHEWKIILEEGSTSVVAGVVVV